jgi:hypothetical protein
MGAGIRNKSKTIRVAALFFGLLAAGGIVAAVSMSTNYKISNAVVTAGGGRSAVDYFTVPTVQFKVLFVFVVCAITGARRSAPRCELSPAVSARQIIPAIAGSRSFASADYNHPRN